MASLDIGIDLGTAVVIATDAQRSVTLWEDSIVALDKRFNKVVGIGAPVYQMIGRTPPYIEVIRPLADGVISNFDVAGILIKHLLKKICSNAIVKPRVCVCVPSGITSVESQAVVDSTIAAGARRVFLIEEPVAAAIGAGVDLSRPNGNMIVDIGGGTTDIAVLSLNGIVCKASIKTAGTELNEAIVRYMRSKYSLLVGERTAEQLKFEIGNVNPDAPEKTAEVRGRDLLSGLPKKMRVSSRELLPILAEVSDEVIRATQSVLERTPPELVGDIRDNGIIMTGGGALLGGLHEILEKRTKVTCKIAENPQECVADGTAKSFQYLDQLFDGFVSPSSHIK